MSDLRENLGKIIEDAIIQITKSNDLTEKTKIFIPQIVERAIHEIGSCGECEQGTLYPPRPNEVYCEKHRRFPKKTDFCSDFEREAK